MNETLKNLNEVLPYVAILCGIAAFLGWSFRGKPAPATSGKSNSNNDKSQQDRARNLEAALEKSKAAHKTAKAELEKLQATAVTRDELDSTTAARESAQKALEVETKRISALETDLKKAQETIKNLNNRANDAAKVQKDRSFALENELSKAREQLSLLGNRPDESAGLTAEIERLRESVAVSTRYAGEMRKREAAAVEAFEKAQAQLAIQGNQPRPAASTKIGPVVDSDRISAAKAEVLRLVQQNKDKAAATEILPPSAPVLPPLELFENPPLDIKQSVPEDEKLVSTP